MSEYQTEHIVRIYHTDGWYYEVGVDGDFGDCIALRYSDGGKLDEVRHLATIQPAMVFLLIEALNFMAMTIKKNQGILMHPIIYTRTERVCFWIVVVALVVGAMTLFTRWMLA